MVDADKQRFAQVMEALGVAYSKEIDRLLKRVYFDACKGMTIDEVERSAARHIQSSQFFPKPADLIGKNDVESLAIEAYRIADQAMSRYGSYRHMDFEDKAINAAIRSIGGWASFGSTTKDEEPFVRDRFIKAYKAYRQIGVGDEAGKAITGIGEADGCTRGDDGRVQKITVRVVRVACRTAQRPQNEQAKLCDH